VEEHRASAPVAASGAHRFDERLSVPWWWYVPTIGLGVLLGAEVHMGYPGLRSWIGYVVFVPLLVGAVTWLGRTRVTVTDTELRVGDAVLPLRQVGRVDVVAREDKQAALGPELDPSAHLVHRPWIGPVVRVEVTDPADPTPYWAFSVRHAERLVAILTNGPHAPDVT
jgi:hypothetical protein